MYMYSIGARNEDTNLTKFLLINKGNLNIPGLSSLPKPDHRYLNRMKIIILIGLQHVGGIDGGKT